MVVFKHSVWGNLVDRPGWLCWFCRAAHPLTILSRMWYKMWSWYWLLNYLSAGSHIRGLPSLAALRDLPYAGMLEYSVKPFLQFWNWNDNVTDQITPKQRLPPRPILSGFLCFSCAKETRFKLYCGGTKRISVSQFLSLHAKKTLFKGFGTISSDGGKARWRLCHALGGKHRQKRGIKLRDAAILLPGKF